MSLSPGMDEAKGADERLTALPPMEPVDFDRPAPSSFSASSINLKGEWELDTQALIRGAEDIVTKVLYADDDALLNPCTFRMWFIGIGLGIFGALMETIYFFRPVTLDVSNIFLALCAYMIGIFMENAIPRMGAIGRWLNPHSFNAKEQAAIVVVASSASQVALAIGIYRARRCHIRREQYANNDKNI
ncbi:uncharacterized protein EI97DRAFT_504915 [Westerdykella ornata]|uniref:OPT-domain-containing protein n=1 Tax=Westerdykella ornata TaxID=318751 RepID=A0A6A6J6B4_WESOR|nr:uncharacterized protein EI97DRAFT_504915 [Westerdykella ornata]KAF2271508.1 hypothetical protein EI97DRAFT_504915 [Westerdykella ornata]